MKGRVAGGIILGMAVGVAAYTFVYARGYSYMTDNAEACVNCHVMQDQFSGWLKSSHRAVAVCNDCHTPPGLVGKYATKAQNGFWHSYYFTTGWFPDNIHITPRGQCVLCCEDYDEKYVVGDLNESTIAEVLEGDEIAKLRRWVYGIEEAPEDFMCRDCVFARH